MNFLIALQIILPLALIMWLAIAPPHNWLGFIIQVLATAVALVAIALAGLWGFPPWWTPYLYGLLLMVAIVVGLQRRTLKPRPSSWLAWGLVIGFMAFGVVAANIAVHGILGHRPPPLPTVELGMPLREGRYLALNGGSDISINAHLKTMDASVPRFRAYRGNGYAVDFVELGAFGLRAQGIRPSQLNAYYIYGETVTAPCAGQITVAVDGLPDMTVPELDRDNLAGNHVILRCEQADVVLAHFRPGSLAVQRGSQVVVGDRIAEVGNSGASDEPHLHIHAQRPGTEAAPLSGDPLPMRFSGRFLVRNDRITVP
ncbi:MAG: M23 family metallopeptidase [Elainellaceae cyanobacterium]